MNILDGDRLDGVAATTLWTLYNRATEAERYDSPITDPMAVELLDRINYDFEKFGKPGQSQPLRALAFDDAIRSYLDAHPGATVVALGEGLQTTYWRVRDLDPSWVSVDLPAVIELRSQLLPDEPAIRSVAASALDDHWMEGIDPEPGVFISAEGLLMYFEESDALGLIRRCAERFPGGQMIFDAIPKWFSDKTLKGMRRSDRYVLPPMPFSLSRSEALTLPDRIPEVTTAQDVRLPPGRGAWGNPLFRAMGEIPVLRDYRPTITLLSFGAGT